MTDAPADERNLIPADEARAVLGGAPATVQRLGHSRRGATRAVWRVTSDAGARAILKVVGPRDDDRGAATRRPESAYFWAREPAILGGGLPAAYRDAGIRAPRLLARFERPDEGVAMWIEHLDGRSGAELTIDDLAGFARRLGIAQGRIAGEGLPDVPWLGRGFLRDYLRDTVESPVAGGDWQLRADDPRWGEPSMAAVEPELREALIRLQVERDRFLGWVEAAPPTLAHLDVWPPNVFIAGDDIALIDWAFAGVGSLGEDIGNLVPDAVFDLLHPPAILEPLERAVFAAYVDGLRAGGWTGDERLVRLAMCASAVKYDWIAPWMLRRSGASEQEIYGTGPAVPSAELFAARAAVMRRLAAWADEARSLAAELGLDGPNDRRADR